MIPTSRTHDESRVRRMQRIVQEMATVRRDILTSDKHVPCDKHVQYADDQELRESWQSSPSTAARSVFLC